MPRELLGKMVAYDTFDEGLRIGMVVDYIQDSLTPYLIEWYGHYSGTKYIYYSRDTVHYYMEEYNRYKNKYHP
jgi:hypothetical protein